MIYLDYSATTPVDKGVLDSFNKTCLDFIGNPNSFHILGVKSNELINNATKQIANLLKVKENEIIYTSGSSESNNLAIKGIMLKYQNRGKHIITTAFEHSSIYGPISYLETLGFEYDFVDVDEKGQVDLKHLKSLLREDTILVSINSVNSEIGMIQPISEIAKILESYPKCFFHSDMTQSMGKIDIPLDGVDLVSFSAHKFFGLKGIGCLIKKDKILLEPLIHGGKSTTIFRSGTPALPLIVSLAKALRLAYTDIDNNLIKVKEYNDYLKEKLEKYPKVKINSNDICSPYVLNLSIIGVKPETFVHALEKDDIFISTQSACSTTNTASKAVLALTNDIERANSSIRISLSYVTTKEELDTFLKVFEKCYYSLVKDSKK
ncbi:MAG: cysteine desulfurase family protein [Bacilli bacterium]|nr:cysteine desulfurase family protein [Bacilli bacterium]